jgi:parvulin-like peptidyl-prolyl isomerase
MAEGWKQVWEDILNAMRGGESGVKAETPTSPVEESSPPLAPAEASPAMDESGADSPLTLAHTVEKIDSSAAETEEIHDTSLPVVPRETEGEIFTGAPPLEDAPTFVPSESVEAVSVEFPPFPLTKPAGEDFPTSESGELLPPGSTLLLSGEGVAALTPRQLRWRRFRTGVLYLLLVILFGASLWFSGGSGVWARWTAPQPPADDVIATFEGGQITIADVEAHLALLMQEEIPLFARSPDLLLEIIEDMVTDELVRQWAATRQPDQDEDFRHTMQHISESLNLESLDLQRHEGEIQVAESEIQDYYNENREQFGDLTLDQVREEIRQTLISEREQGYIEEYMQRLKDNASITFNFELLDVPVPSEDDLRRYYDANLDLFKLPRQVVVDEMQFSIGDDETIARRDADDALLKVRSGATFGEVAQVISSTVVFTGTLISEGTRDPAWDTAVFELTEGELSDVFRAGDAFYLVRLNELQPARTQTLEEVRATVLAAVQQQTSDEWFSLNGSKTLFTLKGKQYTLGQFYQEYQELPVFTQAEYTGPEGMKGLAEQLIERLLLVEDAYDQLLDVENKPLTDEARLQVLKQMLHQEEVDDKITITDEEMQQFYDENIDLMALPPSARIRYIRIGLGSSEDEQNGARARADEAYQKLVPGLFQQGAEFAAIAQEYSEDPETAVNGGEYPDWIGESEDILAEMQIHPFHEIILTLEPGEISQPFEFGDSLYIVQVIERSESEPISFEEAKPFLEEILTEQKHDELLTQVSEQLFEQANVVIYQEVLEAYFKMLETEMLTPVP